MALLSIDSRWCGTYILDENRNAVPATTLEWAKQLEEMRGTHTKHVGDDIVDGKRISTVWFGLDHQWDDNGKPLIFETMIFNKNGFSEIYMDRYSTWDEAEEGHQKAIEWVNNGCKD